MSLWNIDITIVNCSRCGAACKLADSTTEDARLLKHATKPETSGFCPDCGVTDFFKHHSPLAMLMEQNPLGGKKMLLDVRVQEHFSKLLEAGNADASPQEINWQRVYDNWELPFPKVSKRKKG
jgi:ribosomal protein S27AE